VFATPLPPLPSTAIPPGLDSVVAGPEIVISGETLPETVALKIKIALPPASET
jgi:hypothetical protein